MRMQGLEAGPNQSPDHACGSPGTQGATLHRVDGEGSDGRAQSRGHPSALTAEGEGRRHGPRRAGPKTLQGKARVRLNAVRHGLCATVPVIPGVERVTEWEGHRAGVRESLAPVGHLETVLAERVALLLWRLNRVTAYERAELAEAHKLLGDGRRRVHLLPGDKVDKVMRYEAHLGRQLYHSMHELEALQRRRRGEQTPLARLDVHGLSDAS